MKKSKFLLAILGAATIASSITLPYNTFATSKTAEVKVTIPESISLTLSNNNLNLDLSDTDFHTDSLTVTGTTNSAAGYTISFNTNNDYNDLKHSNTLVADLIPSITEDKTASTFPQTAWGYSAGTETFSQIPLTVQSIFETSVKGQSSHTFTAGAKAAATTAAGEYENELLFTIVANPSSENNGDLKGCNSSATNINDAICMQDMNSDIKATMALEQQYQLKDGRDGKVYWVAKLKDGNIWMTQNLDYDLSVEANQTLTPETSNVNSTHVMEIETISAWAEESKNNAAYFLEGGDSYYLDGFTQMSDLSTLPEDSVERHYAQGDYYSWKAATAGQGTTDIDSGVVDESICPSGWRLPVSYSTTADYSFGNLIKQYGYSGSEQYTSVTDETLRSAPLFFTRGGEAYRGMAELQGNYGYYWSAETFVTYGAYTFYFYQVYVNPNYRFNDRSLGFAIRCVAE